ncbi:hypothetical protein D3854_01240 [Streptococcus mutans]|nr:hypothetical protein [Streptococcus mutans]NLQ50872.1 hypothetical protein [Streptococcus mutans]NLQ85280.1 hypothetical protein [Streptococcus mutans]QGU40108.1 hypothetical protein F5989_03595 [Streptococcus mutans]
MKIRAINVLTVLPAKRKAALPFAIKVTDNHSNSLETYVSREFFEKFEEKAYFKTFPSTLKCPLDCLSRRQ